MYLIDVGTATAGSPDIHPALFSLVTYGAPEEIRTPNLLIRSCSKLSPLLYAGRKLAGCGGVANVPVSPRTLMNETQTETLRARQAV
jgi:hypothetical protein